MLMSAVTIEARENIRSYWKWGHKLCELSYGVAGS